MDIKALLAGEIAKVTGLEAEEVVQMLETPPDAEKMGDLALPCFKLAKTMRKAPPQIAADIMQNLEKPEYISEIKVIGGYLNFYYNSSFYIQSVLQEVCAKGENWGSSTEGEGKTVVIDYSSINIAKPFHIGHLSSTAIGSALYKIYKYLGYNTVGVNHLGDWGTQFGKIIAAYKRWGDDEEIKKDTVMALMRLYVRFHDEAEKDEALNEDGREWFKKIEDGDEEALRIFGWFKELTLKEVKAVYDKLNVTFDSYDGESFYNDKMEPIINELREKNMLQERDGAYEINLDEYDLPPAVLLRSDGATLYATRDLAAAEYRKKTYGFYKNLYVVAYQQNLHFRQVFAMLNKMGRDWVDGCEHVAFGMVSLEDGTLSTRKGKVILLEDVLSRAVSRTTQLIDEKNPQLENKETIAEQIGIGAVIYSVLAQSRIKDITFSFDRVLNFDGETGPYVQYTHTRCLSVIARAPKIEEEPDYSALENQEALAVIKKLEEFPNVVRSAAEKNEPFYVTRFVTELAQAFNRYYYAYKIIEEGDLPKTKARIIFTHAVKDVIFRGLSLLGISTPEKM